MGKRRPITQKKKLDSLHSDLNNLAKVVTELKIIVGGSSSLDKKGLMQSQREDEQFKKEILSKLDQIKEDGKKASRELDSRLKTIEGYFSLATNKTVWKFILFALIAMLLISNWTRDLYQLVLDYFKKSYL